eukprot:2595237-Prymnesium_polylepis.1
MEAWTDSAPPLGSAMTRLDPASQSSIEELAVSTTSLPSCERIAPAWPEAVHTTIDVRCSMRRLVPRPSTCAAPPWSAEQFEIDEWLRIALPPPLTWAAPRVASRRLSAGGRARD